MADVEDERQTNHREKPQRLCKEMAYAKIWNEYVYQDINTVVKDVYVSLCVSAERVPEASSNC